MRFEWDDEKNKRDIQKHGIDFRDTKRVFENPVLARTDERKGYGEKRWIGLGSLDDLIIVIVYARRGKTIRIISARKANRKERRIYEETISSD